MHYLKFEIERGAGRLAEADHRVLVRVVAFLLGAHRHRQARASEPYDPRMVSEGLDPATFSYMLRRLRMYLDGVTTENGKIDTAGAEACSYLLREHVRHRLSLSAVSRLLFLCPSYCVVIFLMAALTQVCALQSLCKSERSDWAELGAAVHRVVFYDYSHLHIFVELLRAYGPHLFTKRYRCYYSLSLLIE